MMSSIDDYIVGNSLVHSQFRVCVAMLCKMAAAAPESVTLEQIEELTGYSLRGLEKLCCCLWARGLIHRDPGKPAAWLIACDPEMTTLETVFRCLLAEQERSKPLDAQQEVSECPGHEVDLLVMQMTVAINQGVFNHLRQFTLARLRMALGRMFPFPQPAVPEPDRHEEESAALLLQTVRMAHMA